MGGRIILNLMHQVNYHDKTAFIMQWAQLKQIKILFFSDLRRGVRFALSIMCFMWLSACEKPFPSNGLEAILKGRSFFFAPGFSDSQINQVRADFLKLASVELNTSKNPIFEKAFGSNSGESVLDFLELRTHYYFAEPSPIGDPDQSSRTAFKIAINRSSIWLSGLLTNQTQVIYIGDNVVPVRDPRIGIVSLIHYLDSERPIAQILRLQTLVHEARHSDCTGGLNDDDYDSFYQGDFSIGSQCLHGHVVCPTEHSLAGLNACDPRPWGAYSMAAVFSNAIYENCSNCTEREKQIGLMGSLDSLSRVLNRDPIDPLPLSELDLSSSTKLPSTHPLRDLGIDSTQDEK